MAARLSWLRLRRQPLLEIDFDPNGVVVGQWAKGHSNLLIHHHHEILFADGTSRHTRPARIALPNADLVVVADEGRRALMEGTDPKPKRVLTVRNAPLACDVIISPKRRTEAFSVVYFGVISNIQCLDVIVKSMALWPPETTFHLYGPPSPFQATLRSIAQANGTASRLFFEGWIDASDLIDRVARHHLAVTLLRPLNDNLQFAAGASNKRFQAMAAGLPQVSDNNPGVSDLVHRHGVGVCVPCEDEAAIAAAVCQYVADPKRVRQEGERARRLVLEKLNYETEFAAILAMYRELTGENSC